MNFGGRFARPSGVKFGTSKTPSLHSRREKGQPPTNPSAHYAENELPQPQDLVEFGFTKTNPCCIKVS